MLALSFSLLALGLWHTHRPTWAGIFGGLALLSGPAFWQGALGLGLAWLFYRLLLRSASQPGEVFDEANEHTAYPTRTDTLRWLVVFITTILVVGTYFFHYSQGLTASVASLTTYLEGWTTFSGVSPMTLIFVLLTFQPLAMIFSLVSLGRWLARRLQNEVDGRYTLLLPLLWLLTSLILTLIYPLSGERSVLLVPLALLPTACQNTRPKMSHIISCTAGLILVLQYCLEYTHRHEPGVLGNLPKPSNWESCSASSF
jgi:hypothetical protein